MPQTFYTEEEYKEVLNDLRAVQHRLDVVERQRPQWAFGYTSDSMAAQGLSAALSQLYEGLGARNQTEAVQRLTELLRKDQKPAF